MLNTYFSVKNVEIKQRRVMICNRSFDTGLLQFMTFRLGNVT